MQEKEKVKRRKFGTNYIRHLLLNPCTGSRGAAGAKPICPLYLDKTSSSQGRHLETINLTFQLQCTTMYKLYLAKIFGYTVNFTSDFFVLRIVIHFLFWYQTLEKKLPFLNNTIQIREFSLFNQLCKPLNIQTWKTIWRFQKMLIYLIHLLSHQVFFTASGTLLKHNYLFISIFFYQQLVFIWNRLHHCRAH